MPAREHKTASDPEAKPATAHRIRLARVQGIDQIWLINLDRRPDRLEQFMQRHPEMSGRINRLSAYDGQSLELTPTLARLFAPNNFEWHKPTMGCAMSHLALWYKLAGEADENASYLILEDDALLDPSWVAKAEKAFFINSVPADWEVLFLGGILPKYRETFEKNVQPLNRMVARVNPEYVFGNNPRGYFHFCAYAYLLNKRGAQRLLELVEGGNGVWMQADFFACYTTPELSPPRPVYFTHPLLAESFQDSTQGFARPYDDGTDHSEKVDSDIWKNDQRFSPEEVAACSVDGLLLDIPGGLGLEPRPVSSPPTVAGQDSLPSSGHMVAAAPGPGAKKVGLICVTRNSAEKLKVTLDSIARNTDLGLFDLYVVDNGSSDATAEVCAGKWPDNFFFLRKNENLGWVGAINSCLHVAEKYPFIGFLHDDIEVGPRWLEHLAGILEYHKVVGAVGPLTSNERDWQGYDRFRLGPVRPGLPELPGIERSNVVEMSAAMSGFNPGITLNDATLAFFCVLIRSEIIKKTGLLDPAFNDLYLGDNDDYCKRILGSGHLLALSFNAYVAHHSGSRSLSVDNYAERYKLAQKIIADKAAKGLYDPRKNPATSARNSAAENESVANGKTPEKSTGAKIAAGSEGKLIEQNLGHMVCEGHLGGFFSEGDGGTYYPLMWTHLVRKYGIRSVLDVGCGRGYSALYFQSLGCKITGIDGSEEAAATQLIGNDFVRADYSVGSSGLADGCDLVWSCEFVEHVEERFMANYLQDFRRGKYLAMTFAGPGQPGHHHVNCRPAEYWIRVLHAWGFDFLSDETTELREKARQDMEKNDQSSDKRFVYHFMHRGLFLKNTGKL